MPGKPAARVTDVIACPLHVASAIATGSPDVLINGLPAARQGDASTCASTLVSNVIPSVLINGRPAAVIGSLTSHGGMVIAGSPTVLIGPG